MNIQKMNWRGIINNVIDISDNGVVIEDGHENKQDFNKVIDDADGNVEVLGLNYEDDELHLGLADSAFDASILTKGSGATEFSDELEDEG